MIDILIVDDHAIVRAGLNTILELEKGFSVTGMAKNTAEALKIISSKKIDVMVLDVSLPGRSGLEIIKEAKQIQPLLKIIMLSIYPEDRFAIRALKAGASGYLTKEMAPEMIVEAIRKVSSGGKYITPVMAEKLADELNELSEKTPHERLSDREFDVMCMMGSGNSLVDIAVKLGISDRTVSTYRTRILKKMSLKNNSEVIHYVIDNGLI
ncbi:MAG: response regulator transcription factor [Bacteroidota bacterium]